MERLFKKHLITVLYNDKKDAFIVSCYRISYPYKKGFDECVFEYTDSTSYDKHEAMNKAKIHLSTGLKLKIY